MATKKSEVEQTANQAVMAYVDAETEWQSYTEDSDTVKGHSLVEVDEMVGVPFVLTGITYREGTQIKGVPYRNDYVSLEMLIAPESVISPILRRIEKARERAKLSPALTVKPGEHVVINDGSTGIYRNITEYLHSKGLIKVANTIVANGAKNECSWDLPRSQWIEGAEAATEGIAVKLTCPRGVRVSQYASEYSADGAAETYYIA